MTAGPGRSALRIGRRLVAFACLAALTACSALPQPSISTPGLPQKERLGNGPTVVGVISFSEPNNLAGGTADATFLAAKLAIQTASGLPATVELRNGAAMGPRAAAEQLVTAGAKMVILPRDAQATKQAQAVLAGKAIASVGLGRDGDAAQQRYGAGFNLAEEVQAIVRDIASRQPAQVIVVTSAEIGSEALAKLMFAHVQAAGLPARQLVADRLDQSLRGAALAGVPAALYFATSPETAANALAALPPERRTGLDIYGNAEWALAVPIPPDLRGARFAAPADNLLRDFSRRFTGAYGQRPTLASALVYDLTIMAAALPAASPSDPFGREALLASEGFRGFSGHYVFGGQGVAQPRDYSIYLAE